MTFAAIAANPAVQQAAIGFGTKILGGVFGKVFGGKKKKADFTDQARLEQNRYKWLVKGAQNAGFNPLTVLRSTGGSMGQVPDRAPGLSGGDILAAAVQQGAQAYQKYDPVAEETAKLERDILKQERDAYAKKAPPFLQGVRKTASPTRTTSTTAGNPLDVNGSVRPYSWQDDRPTVEVRDGDSWRRIPADQADRLRLNRGDTLMAEDREALDGGMSGLGNVTGFPARWWEQRMTAPPIGPLSGYTAQQRQQHYGSPSIRW